MITNDNDKTTDLTTPHTDVTERPLHVTQAWATPRVSFLSRGRTEGKFFVQGKEVTGSGKTSGPS